MKSLHRFAMLGIAAAAAGFAFTTEARADEVVIPGKEISSTHTEPNRAMLDSGVFALGVPYVTSIIVGATSNHPGDKDLYVPVAGPWMDLGDRHCAFGTSCNHEGLNKGLLVVDGIFQGIGALQIVGAFLFPETITVSSASTEHHLALADVSHVQVGPSGVGSGYGLSAIGRF